MGQLHGGGKGRTPETNYRGGSIVSMLYQAGRYRAEVIQQAMGKASTNNPQFTLRIKILEAYTAPGVVEPVAQQYERTIYRVITEKSMAGFERDLEALGLEVTSMKQLDPATPGYTSVVGTVIDCLCAANEWNGETNEKWSVAWLDRAGGDIEVTPLNPAEYRQLDALFSKSKKGGGKVKATAEKVKTAPAPVTGRITDDDVPF
jgi:hypothetical protein